MLRGIAGVILGYIVMFVIVFACLTVAYLAMGTDSVFLPASYTPGPTWMIIMVVVGIVASVLGGLICAVVAGSSTAPKVLAALVLVLGLLLAVGAMMANKPVVERTGTVTNLQAMQNAREPLWFSFANPVIGAIGVLVGAGFKRRKA